MSQSIHTRRRLVGATLATGALMAGGSVLSVGARAAGKTKINMQLGWLIGGNQLGEIVAKQLGYFDKEDIDFQIQPGGPSIDGVAVVASGRFELGQVSSSPSLMLAVSQGLPIKCFAVGIQKHPYCFFSLAKNPVRKPADMVDVIGISKGRGFAGLVKRRSIPGRDPDPRISGRFAGNSPYI